MKRNKLTALVLSLALGLSLTACAPKAPVETTPPPPTPTTTVSETPTPTPSATDPVAEKTKVRLAVLKGNTGMSAVKLLSDADEGIAANDYEYTIAADPQEVNSKLINGDYDIAALPTNVAALLYNKTGGEIQMLSICGLGVLYVLENGTTVNSIGDLRGKTLYATGQGANPEYVLNYLLEQNGLEPGKDVAVEWKTADELTTLMASGDITLAMMPVPAGTAVTVKNPDVRFALDFTQEWSNVNTASVLTMSCVVVRKEFAEKNPQAVADFLKEYEASVNYVRDNVAEGAELVAGYGITPNAKIAAEAIPQVNLLYMAGEDMQPAIQGYYDVLVQADPKSIGGSIPGDEFYYVE